MNVKAFITAVSILFLLGVFISVKVISNVKTAQVDTVAMNQIVKSIENNWENTETSAADYYILRNNDIGYHERLNEAIVNRDTVVDIIVNDAVAGKVIFYNNFNEIQNTSIRKMMIATGCMYGLLFLIFIFYHLYLKHILYKPFHKLKKFASNVSAGNLDFPLDMDRHNVFGAFTESFDIMRCEIKKARENENLANKAKKELIAELSHDIKTPLASIKAIGEFLLATVSDDKITSKISTLYEKAEQIDRLVTDMFNATLEELGKLNVNIKDDHSTIVGLLIQNADYLNRASITKVPECMIKIDALRLGQVIDNVFSNSYKYADTNIYVNFELTKTHMEININDYGNGVSDDELLLLFGKFYRGNNVGTQSGSGLGLYIAKYLMEKQGGDMICYNRNDGFSVKLIIPLS